MGMGRHVAVEAGDRLLPLQALSQEREGQVSLGYLSECACGHVANHHTRRHGCHVSGCPCRAFDAGHVSLEKYRETVALANREIKRLEQERNEARAALAEREGK